MGKVGAVHGVAVHGLGQSQGLALDGCDRMTLEGSVDGVRSVHQGQVLQSGNTLLEEADMQVCEFGLGSRLQQTRVKNA